MNDCYHRKDMLEVDVSIIVPTYNEGKVILNCLNSLVSLDYPADRYEIIIVNDGSIDRTVTVISAFAKEHSGIILLSKENGGKASALNFGLRYAKGKDILIIDADTTAEKGWVSKMKENLEKNDVVFGVCYVECPDNWLEKAQNAYYLINYKFGGLRKLPASGANNGFRKEVIERIGYFNESTTSVTGDFIKRIKNSNLKAYFNPKIEVFTRGTKGIKSFLKQKLRWREYSLSYLKGEKITFSDLFGLGYTIGLSFILFAAFFLSIFLLNYQYFLFSFIGIFLISFLLHAKPFLKMCNSKEKKYAKYFIGYLSLEMIIRMILIPYLTYRLIRPRKKPTFEAGRG